MNIDYKQINNANSLMGLHKQVSKALPGMLARTEEECSLEYFQNVIDSSLKSGIIIGAYDGNNLIGFIYAGRSSLKVFSHILLNVTMAVHPGYQGKGIGKELFGRFMSEVKLKNDITRIELFVVEVNKKAIKLYESFGFQKEGIFKKRAAANDKVVDDIAMAWLRD